MIEIRKAVPEDADGILFLIKELAAYEKAANEVEITKQQLLADGFSDVSLFECLVATDGNDLVGMALYYPRYSTWKGKYLYLEDLVVSQTRRREGIGKLLFERLIEVARDYGAKRLEWQVLDWNEPAIKFYEGYHAHLDKEWINCRLTDKQMEL